MLPFILIALLSAVAQFFLPWWVVGIVAFGICYWRSQSGVKAFLNAFLGTGVVWLIYAVMLNTQNDGILSGRMTQLVFKSDNAIVMLLATTLVGGLAGGFSGLAGYHFRQVFQAKA